MTTIIRSPKEDYKVIYRWMLGNEDATRLLMAMFRMFHVWDDLVDKDKDITEADINDAFWIACVTIPTNRFFQAYSNELQPIITQSIQDWKVANSMERSGNRDKQITAYSLRCNVIGIIHHCALIVGGRDYADDIGEEIRVYGQIHNLEEYLENLPCQT